MRLPLDQGEPEVSALAAALAFGLRMGGMLHPYTRFSDTGLHLNNLAGLSSQVIGVAAGSLFFSEGLPCEAGAGQSPYPPGAYLALAPGLLITGPDLAARRWLLQGGVALLEGFGAAIVWLLLRRFGRGAALLGALLYAAAPPLLRSYSVGEMTNLFAQSLVPPLILLLVLLGSRVAPGAGPDAVEGRTRRASAVTAPRTAPGAALLPALLAALLLTHTGVTISAAALLAAWLGLNGAHRRDGAKARMRAVGRVVGGGAVAAAAAVALYYSAYGWVFDERRELALVQASLPAAQRCPPERPLADKLQRWVAGQVTDERPALAGPLLLGGAAGALLAMGGLRRLRPIGLVLVASWLGAILSLATLLGSDQAVRWQPFLFPALCVGAGLALDGWRRRGRAGRWLALAAAGFLIWYAVADWVRQVATYLH